MSDRSLRRATRICWVVLIAFGGYAIPHRIAEIYTCGWECPANQHHNLIARSDIDGNSR